MTRPLYLPLHRITPHEQIADQIEEQDFEARLHTSLRAPLDDEPETVITSFGGLAEPRKSIVRSVIDALRAVFGFVSPDDKDLMKRLDAGCRQKQAWTQSGTYGKWSDS